LLVENNAVQVEPEQLPHWGRVAFAAGCARRVQPLFAEAWPDAIHDRVAAVERAIALAEQSAAEQQASGGLKEALIGALRVAGRALIRHHYPAIVEREEPAPADPQAALVASFTAKVAEKAAEAAAAAPGDSGRPVREAYQFALDAIRAAGRSELMEVLEADLVAAARKAHRKQ
jgi:hypothetical protein